MKFKFMCVCAHTCQFCLITCELVDQFQINLAGVKISGLVGYVCLCGFFLFVWVL